MPKARKQSTPTHVLVPDTNILWHEDKKHCVHPDFDKFWEEYKTVVKLELLIPDVVLGELLFQQTTSAIKCFDNISTHTKKLSEVAKSEYKNKFSKNKIKNDVNKKLSDWLKSKNGKKEITPIEDIDWENLIKKAIWRIPPFTLDAKKENNEKGFRDSLIMETLLKICEKNKKIKKILFL